jgi:hypothetical protein
MITYILLVGFLVFVFFLAYSGAQAKKKFKLEYSEFLAKNEGLELFCYTNREKFQNIIEEKLLPNLDESISFVKLIGKEPNADLDKKFISYALCRLNNIGFPNVMKIVNDQFLDISLHNEIYNCINNKKQKELVSLVNEKLKILRDHGE